MYTATLTKATTTSTPTKMNKISSTDSPSHNKTLISTTSTNSSSSSSNTTDSSNLTNKLSNSFIRTATLPRRFKEKFLTKTILNSTTDSLANQSVNSLTISSNSTNLDDHHPQQQQSQQHQQQPPQPPPNELIINLNKLISKYFKTIKYLEQIINKQKYEIIASSTTAALESVIDIYNLIITFNLSNDLKFKQCRDKINKSLAQLIKWSDSIMLDQSLSLSDNLNNENKKLNETSKKLIKHLNKSIRNLIKYLKTSDFDLVKSISSYSSSSPSLSTLSSVSSSASSLSMSISPQDKASSLSSVSSTFNKQTPLASNNNNNNTQHQDDIDSKNNMTITTVIDEKNGTKTTTIHKKSLPSLNQSSFSLLSSSNSSQTSGQQPKNSYFTQTSTLTTTTSSSGDILTNKTSDLNAFFDLDRLVLELSELSNDTKETTTIKKSFTNEQCDYIVSQFESFAKKFNSSSSSNDVNKSVSSTLNRSNFSGSTILSFDSQINRKTLHTNKVFKHDLDQKLCVIEGIIKDLKVVDTSDSSNQSVHNEFQQIEKEIAANGRILTRLIDHKTLNKTDFIETNLVVDDKSVDEILLKTNNDPVRSFMSLFDDTNKLSSLIKTNSETNSRVNTNNNNNNKRERRRSVTSSSESESSSSSSPLRSNRSSSSVLSQKDDSKPVDSVDEEDDDDGNINQLIFGANNLNPQFLLIDDDDDDINDLTTQATFQTKDDDDINDYKDNLIDQLDKDDDLHIKKLIDDSISIHSYNLLSLKLDNKKSVSTWSLVSNKSADKCNFNTQKNTLTTLPSSSTIQQQQTLNQNELAEQEQVEEEENVLDLLDVNHLLEYQTSNKLNPINNILRGGHIDALIVLATTANTNVVSAVSKSKTIPVNNNNTNLNEHKGNFLFQEAFLTTYRTIIEPIDLINKLIYRYRLFSKYASNKKALTCASSSTTSTNSTSKDFTNLDDKFDLNRLKSNAKTNKLAASAARNSLALLVRVLDDLGNELNEKIIELFADFVYELLIDNELQLARLLRKKLLFKLDTKRTLQTLNKNLTFLTKKSNGQLDSVTVDPIPHPIQTKRSNQSILDFKSIDLAQQITLIDLNLFLKIELSEVLLWSTKQSEKYSPNLIKFTEHFNKISYWARSRILEHDSIKEREKIVVKFLKIMKHLRKYNNFNSYLSILSAVDSGPIQRLDWPKSLTDNIKEFAVLIDPKCGFKCLREAVAEAQPPCIPHIGLILQDLTILHIANSDYLPSGNCNFWKRWQQYNILERLRCFRRCNYDFKPDTKIHKFFNNFEDYYGEDAQYSLSEQLKPRSSNKNH